MSKARRGFMMRDLLVLITIVAIAMPIVIVILREYFRVPHSAYEIRNNLKQVALATHWLNDFHKRLPPATGTFGAVQNGKQSLSVHLLPYVEQSELYFRLKDGGDGSKAFIPPYTAFLDFTTADFQRVQNFAANVRVFTDLGINTPFDANVAGITSSGHEGWSNAKIPDTFSDGTSNTIIFATRYANHTAEGANGNVNCSAYDALVGQNNSAFFGVQSMTSSPTATSASGWQLGPSLSQVNCQFGAVAHSFGLAGIQVGLGDASVRMLQANVSVTTWNFLLQPNDGHQVNDPNW